MLRIGGIEAGGTKFVCGVGNERGEVVDSISFPTEDPETTLGKAIAYFKEKSVDAIGIGSFGPIDLRLGSPTYGYVTTTPKPGWGNVDFLGTLRRKFDVPCGWNTDVNVAAFGEATWGAAKGLKSCLYYTVGTGIGIGVFLEGRLVQGLVHPEGGHMLTRRHPGDDFAGLCPYHGDCLEGMASGPAIEARWNVKGHELPSNHPAWEMEAYYIAQSITGAVLLNSPEKVILGGGVMQQSQLFPLIREAVKANLNGYVSAGEIVERMDEYIVPPGLGQQAGLCGAFALGLAALQSQVPSL
ncbi:ROK family protein [Paenibacillus oleatilyticus]|uniref:ROK family protein n=1 Tax=Paenibacillus oleatilyticus TaxID=2594886 RepID=UPI001C1F4294|nr:ROK family protein [Paenibacillus oleatilyticus]MBU7316635.1 ROK family protein [Paenibacillus oleatilyticus]